MKKTCTIFERRTGTSPEQISSRLGKQVGFSLIELLVVIIIVLIVAASAVPTVLTSVRMAHLRGASSDYAGLLEQARIYSIRDNRVIQPTFFPRLEALRWALPTLTCS